MAANAPFEFTKQAIDDLPLPAAGRDTYRDTRMPRLYLRVTANGVRTFYYVQKVKGRTEWVRLGAYPEMSVAIARKRAEAEGAKFVKGENPAEERRASREAQKAELTFGELWKLYRAAYESGETRGGGRSPRTLDSQWRVWLSRWENKRLSAITDAMVETFRDEIRDARSATTANKILTHGRAMYAYAAKSKRIKYAGLNPFGVVDKFPERRARKERLKQSHIAEFFAALDRVTPTMRDFFMVTLFTGVRAGNVKAMRWDELDLDGGVWTIPRTKSGESHEASLAEPVIALLRARKPDDIEKTPWVFPADSKSGHLETYRKSWLRVLNEAGIKNLRVHDLRRTLSSWAQEAQVSVALVQAQLGHLDPKTTLKHYTTIAGTERRKAVDSTVAAMLEAARGETKH